MGGLPVVAPSLSSSLPSVAVSESVIRSDLTQVVQKLEKENAMLKESLRKSEDQRMKTEIKSKQLETRYSKLESVLSLLQVSLQEKERERLKETTAGDSASAATSAPEPSSNAHPNGDDKSEDKKEKGKEVATGSFSLVRSTLFPLFCVLKMTPFPPFNTSL